ncbi:MAG: chemotaxis protein CheA [Desulfobacterales bacterium]|nr:chemotaxis protein CheA [Desulfobacterales bacterium]
MDTQREAYRVEAYDLLAELETSLLELESDPGDMLLVDRVFRAMHTIKGSGAMFGFDAIAEFTHDVESAFDQVRDGRIPVTTGLVNMALQARDHIKKMLDHADAPAAIDPAEGARIIGGFRAILDGAPQEPPTVDGPGAGREKRAEEEKIFRIRFTPYDSLFQNGTNPLALLAELEALGPCRTIPHLDRLPAAEAFNPEACYLSWDILLTTDRSLNAVQDVFIFVEGSCDLAIDLIDGLDTAAQEPGTRRLGEILVARGDLEPAMVDAALQRQQRLGQILVDARQVSAGKVRAALAEQEYVQSARARREQQSSAGSVRVAADKLDQLVNLVGELVTVQARLNQKAISSRDPELLGISEVVERLTAELRDNTLSIRMLPIDVTFSKLRRLVRDLSNELGKNILLNTEGGDTELDKTVIEQLNDPLVHIFVLIHISDDGAGIDPALIRRKAVEKGLLAPDAERSDKELLQLIFAPGFSTAEAVTNVSGRGVGMDVVKRSLENLRGAIELNSRPGQGTTITLKLPLTLAIIDGLLVEIDTGKFVLPLSSIEECVELSREDLKKTHGRNILNIRGQIVPFVPLRERFAIPGAPPIFEQVVINEVDGQRVGIVVDRVIGEHQIVIKTMNALYKDVQEISGATILGDGTVALILDVQKLLSGIAEECTEAEGGRRKTES